MTVLLDTSAVIGFDGRFTEHFGDEEDFAVSAVTVGELAHGLDIGDEAERAGRRTRLEDVIRRFEVVPYGVEEAKLYGVLASLVRTAGRNPRPRRLDLQIAATAAAARIPLVTSNPRDFAGLGHWVVVVAV